jgi:hypothetical protein
MLRLQEIKRETSLLLFHGWISSHKRIRHFYYRIRWRKVGFSGRWNVSFPDTNLPEEFAVFISRAVLIYEAACSCIPDTRPIVFTHPVTTWHIHITRFVYVNSTTKNTKFNKVSLRIVPCFYWGRWPWAAHYALMCSSAVITPWA